MKQKNNKNNGNNKVYRDQQTTVEIERISISTGLSFVRF